MKELNLSEKKQFFNSIESLYSAGISYTEIFKTIESSSVNINIKQLARIFQNGIEDGIPITDLMMKYQDIVGKQYAMLFCAGDKSGQVEEAVSRIRNDIKRSENLKSSLIGALTYPAILLLGCIGVFIFCQSFFFKIFGVMYTTGICPTAKITLFITTIFKIMVVYALIFLGIYLIVTNKKVLHQILDFIVEKTPLAPFVNNIYFINFFYVLAASYDAGIPIMESVELASTLFKTKKSTLGMIKTTSILKNGGDVTSAFISAQLFSPFALSQIATGEKTGRLGQAFNDIAKDYENQLQNFLNIFIAWLQPATIVIVGIMVAYIAITFWNRLYGGILNAF